MSSYEEILIYQSEFGLNKYYNLEMIIFLGYRVKFLIATQFCRWATERLKEYMIEGFTMDGECLKNLGGKLLERTIRTYMGY